MEEAFMFIFLEHYKSYKKHGLIEPKTVIDDTRQYEEQLIDKSD